MSKKPPRPRPPHPGDTSAEKPPKPLRPRPILLLITSIFFAVWLIALLVMYITLPRQQPAHSPKPAPTSRS